MNSCRTTPPFSRIMTKYALPPLMVNENEISYPVTLFTAAVPRPVNFFSVPVTRQLALVRCFRPRCCVLFSQVYWSSSLKPVRRVLRLSSRFSPAGARGGQISMRPAKTKGWRGTGFSLLAGLRARQPERRERFAVVEIVALAHDVDVGDRQVRVDAARTTPDLPVHP